MPTTEEKPSEGKCSCPCHNMIGVFVFLFGLTFLLRALDVLSNHAAAIIWPIIVMLAGLKTIFRRMCKCCSAS
jgi:hypothetical protein